MIGHLLLIAGALGQAVGGTEKPLGGEEVAWCWTSRGYGDYRHCAVSLTDGDLSSGEDLSSDTGQPAWAFLSFSSLVDLSGLRLYHTGDTAIVITYILSDGATLQAGRTERREVDGRQIWLTETGFPSRLTRAVTLHISTQNNNPFTVSVLDLQITGQKHSNLRRVSDWEHGVTCRYKGRDCGVMVDGFLDFEYHVVVGGSALVYLNDTYVISHLTLLEALPEQGASVYDRMALTLGYPTGAYMKHETYEFTLCGQEWAGSGPRWHQLTLPRPTQARYVNITVVGEEEKLVNGLAELELYSTKGDVSYSPVNLPCMSIRQVVADECVCDCQPQTCNCDSRYTTGQTPAPFDVTTKATHVKDRPENPPGDRPTGSVVAKEQGVMSRESRLLFALCATAGVAGGCLIAWLVTCILLRRERGASHQMSRSARGSQQSLAGEWEKVSSGGVSPGVSPRSSTATTVSGLDNLKPLEYTDTGRT